MILYIETSAAAKLLVEELLPGRHLRSLDALHLAATLRIGADVMLTYSSHQAAAANAAGLPVLAP